MIFQVVLFSAVGEESRVRAPWAPFPLFSVRVKNGQKWDVNYSFKSKKTRKKQSSRLGSQFGQRNLHASSEPSLPMEVDGETGFSRILLQGGGELA